LPKTRRWNRTKGEKHKDDAEHDDQAAEPTPPRGSQTWKCAKHPQDCEYGNCRRDDPEPWRQRWQEEKRDGENPDQSKRAFPSGVALIVARQVAERTPPRRSQSRKNAKSPKDRQDGEHDCDYAQPWREWSPEK